MQKQLLTLLMICSFAVLGFSQKVVLVSAEKILNAMPEYKEAKSTLDSLTKIWQQEIAEEYDVLDEEYRKFDAEAVLLSPELKAQKQEELFDMENEIREKQRGKFGPEGELFMKQSTLIEPIQTKIYKAIEDYSNENGVDIMLDRNSSAGVLFAKDQFDVTTQIMKMLKIQ